MIETRFIISAEEAATITRWQKKHEKHCKMPPTAIGGRYTYCFTPTSVGALASIECVCGKKKCFTDMDKL